MKLERFKVGDELTKLGRKLNLLVDYCKAITPKSGENTRVRQTHAGAYISADKTAVSAVGGGAASNEYASIAYTDTDEYTVTLTERTIAINDTLGVFGNFASTDKDPITPSTLNDTEFVFDVSGGTSTIKIYIFGNDYKWMHTGGTAPTPVGATTTAAEVDKYDDLYVVAVQLQMAPGGTYTATGNQIPDFIVDKRRQRGLPTFSCSSSSLMLDGFMWVINAVASSGLFLGMTKPADGAYEVYAVWDGNFWILDTTSSGYTQAVLVGYVVLASGDIAYQCTNTPFTSLYPVGIDGTRNFVDNALRSHSVTLTAGIITGWTVT